MNGDDIERDFNRQKWIGIIIGALIVAAAGLASSLAFQHDTPRVSDEVTTMTPASLNELSEIGELEGRRVYRFELDDGTRCLAISGHTAGGGLDCDWASRLVAPE
ncbi:hypothetical protein [Marinobacter sp. MBR-105]|jgi:hypothetical protein